MMLRAYPNNPALRWASVLARAAFPLSATKVAAHVAEKEELFG